jgi:beta-1,4-mannosyltransferase
LQNEPNSPLKQINLSSSANSKDIKSSTPFTIEYSNNRIELRKDRPVLLVSSTSWTDDEDFSILLDALTKYDKNISNNNENDIKMLVIITGKGPNKSKYEEIISNLQLGHVKIITLWLSAENYPLLLGSSDLGVSLHVSSSGFDLPMKVVDMFGANLPVAAIGFSW